MLNQADTRAKLATLGVDRVGSTPAQFKTFFSSEVDKWARVVKTTGITVN